MRNFVLVVSMLFLFVGIQAQHAVKLGLGSLFNKDINLKYEYAINEQSSVQLAVMYDTKEKFPGGLLIKSIVPDAFQGKLGGYAIVPSYRYYFTPHRGMNRGFYAAANLKYRHRGFDIETSTAGIPYKAGIDMNTFGGGLGLGWQIVLNQFVIDWYIGGLNYVVHSTKAQIEVSDLSKLDQFKMDAGDALEKFKTTYKDKIGVSSESVLFLIDQAKKSIVETNSTSIKTPKTSFGMLDLRFGLSLGYTFPAGRRR